MMNPGKYEAASWSVPVIYGGPGAGGEMAAARTSASSSRGVLELLQTATTFEGQVDELKTILKKTGARRKRAI